MNLLRTDAGEPILPVPPVLHDGVQRAAGVLDADLAAVDRQFQVTREWNYGGASPGAYDWVELDMTAEVGGAHVTHRLFSRDLTDDVTVRRALRPTLEKFARQLSEYVDRHFDEIRQRIREDLELLAAVPGE
jgi:hypothetical protein